MALYHKHRPQTFASVIGQDPIVQTIKNQVRLGQVAHAYLFSGPRGVGKTTMARVLAKAVNCDKHQANDVEPCNTCNSCQSISQSRSIDVIEIDAASHTGVDHVREHIIDNAQFKPTTSKYKVFIIDEVHMLSTSAFNALLKTLEEPPSYVLFILATTELHKLPDTIISRCQRFQFKKVAHDDMLAQLTSIIKEEGVQVDVDVLDRIIIKSDGCVRDAVSLLDQLLATGEKHITIDVARLLLPIANEEEILSLIDTCAKRDAASGLATLQTLMDHGVHAGDFIHHFIEYLRALLMIKVSSASVKHIDISEAAQKSLHALSEQFSTGEIVTLVDLFLQRRLDMRSSPLPKLPIELAIIEWCCEKEERQTKPPIPTPTVLVPPAPPVIIQPPPSVPSPSPSTLPLSSLTPPEKEEIKPAQTNSSDPVCTIDEARKALRTVISRVEHDSPSLVVILKMVKIKEITGKMIELTAPYSFHQEKLTQKITKKKLEDIFKEILQKDVLLQVSVEEQTQKVTQPDTELQSLTAMFGGEVVTP